MRIFNHLCLIFGFVLFFSTAQAEQDLPITLVDGDTLYRSQMNFVQALDKSTEKVIWKTELYKDIEPETYIPGLEHDVQWIVIKELKIDGLFIRAIDSKNRVYLLNKTSGKIVR